MSLLKADNGLLLLPKWGKKGVVVNIVLEGAAAQVALHARGMVRVVMRYGCMLIVFLGVMWSECE